MRLKQNTLCLLLFIFFTEASIAQVVGPVNKKEVDTTQKLYYIIKGDTIPREFINLDEVVLLNKLKFNSKNDRRRYLILRRKTRKVYPYAKLAAERLTTMSERLSEFPEKRQKRKYTKRVQKYIEEEFSEKLKKLTHTEGQILVKLIHRQTGRTAFELVKELRTGWRAFWYNTTASLFEISLKEEYQPFINKEDYIIEDVLERSFQSNILERQDPAFKIDYLDLTEHWNTTTVKN
ncbi:MAG: hypothetical protein CMC07_10060 [Flavobacteriaceae bacterium]|jgi:hypothetical protein|nr:hypothetical protein [Flavobacteriaceae bacterium]|tara:strand:+ start:8257 stop:8961 length:705 start_codon:yes stop_codon:yes gene_type:complete